MSQEKKPIRIAIGENLWTRALVDGSVRVDGFAVEFHSKVTLPDRLHGVRDGKWQGSDGTLTDYLLEKDAGLGMPKVLGEVQRHTIEKLMDYLEADGLLRRRFTVEELFPIAGRR
jgi:hypothetical protein